MVLKRKRSESELSLSSSSAFSSPPRRDPFSSMDLDSSPIRTSRASTPAHLHSRTLKRFRDSRPSDEEIHRKFYEWRASHQHQHQHQCSPSPDRNNLSHQGLAERTLNMLYTAQQRQHHHHHQTYSNAQLNAQFNALTTAPQPQPRPQAQAQASLHSFWNLPTSATPASAPAAAALIDHPLVYDAPSHCEDCGQALHESDSMDVDGFGAETATGCGSCGKHVCSHCSITDLGEQRRCLICAGKKVWVGGLGWAGVKGLKVC
ncbi:hypothetical protein F5B19DRAFT_494627 [Rostrohypoxylon terebratum]|nr:hypothetical protein F5B19DRAFT_494627 [Rostrohypoxylon terebratum]